MQRYMSFQALDPYEVARALAASLAPMENDIRNAKIEIVTTIPVCI